MKEEGATNMTNQKLHVTSFGYRRRNVMARVFRKHNTAVTIT